MIKPIGSIRPRLYGLPKLQKQDIPLRPILSMIKSLQQRLAKFLNFHFDPVLKFYSRYTVKDYFAFINEIKHLKAKNTFLSSFDVNIFFTSVPLDEIIEICTEKLHSLDKPSLRKDNFIRLFVGYLEYKIIPEFQSIRYIDDCFIITNNVENSSLLFEKLNQVHKAIAFTK